MSAAVTSKGRSRLATVAMVLAVLYLAIDVVLQFLPPYYSVVSDAESNLAVGPFGWAMQFNFAARAVMSGCVVAAIVLTGRSSRPKIIGCALIAFAGFCSFMLVFFATDINRPGEFGMTPRTVIGTVHVYFATAGFVAILLGMLLLTPWVCRTLQLRAATVFLTTACAGLVVLALSLAALPQIVGLAERLCLIGILGWAYVVCREIRGR